MFQIKILEFLASLEISAKIDPVVSQVLKRSK